MASSPLEMMQGSQVLFDKENLAQEDEDQNLENRTTSFQAHPAHFLMVGLLIGIVYSVYNSNRDLTNKLAVLLILVMAIFHPPFSF